MLQVHHEELDERLPCNLQEKEQMLLSIIAGSEEKANEVVDEIKAMGREAIAIQANVSNAESVSN